MAKKTPKDKAIDAICEYFSLKDSPPTPLAMGILNRPEDVQLGMFHVALDIIHTTADRGLEGQYVNLPNMEYNSIIARQMIDRL